MGVVGLRIKVLGTGCPRCKATYELVKKIVEREKIEAELEYVTDLDKMLELGAMASPAIWIDGEVVLQGRMPSEEEISEILKKKLERDSRNLG